MKCTEPTKEAVNEMSRPYCTIFLRFSCFRVNLSERPVLLLILDTKHLVAYGTSVSTTDDRGL